MKGGFDELVAKTKILIREIKDRENEIRSAVKSDEYKYDSDLSDILVELERNVSVNSNVGHAVKEDLIQSLKIIALYSEISDIVLKSFPELIFDIVGNINLADNIDSKYEKLYGLKYNKNKNICNYLFLITTLIELPYFYNYFATYWLEEESRSKELNLLLKNVLKLIENKESSSKEEILHNSKCLMTTILLWEKISPIRNYLKRSELLFEIMEKFVFDINKFENNTIKYLFVRLYSNLLELNENGRLRLYQEHGLIRYSIQVQIGKFVKLKDDNEGNLLDIYLQYFIFKKPVFDSFDLLLSKGLCFNNTSYYDLESCGSNSILKIYNNRVVDEITRIVISNILTCNSLIFLENISNGLQVYYSVLDYIKQKYFDKYHNFNIIRLYLDNTTDSKSLLGNWVVGDKPGEFKWEHGILSLCLIRGDWLLIENIQDVPKDVIVKLNEISEVISRNIFICKNNFGVFSETINDNYFEIIDINKRIKIHPNFRIFSSCITTKNDYYNDNSRYELCKDILFSVSNNEYVNNDVIRLLNMNKWSYCIIPTPTMNELTKGIELYYSNLSIVKDSLLNSFRHILNVMNDSESYFGINYNKYLNTRKPSCKDFFKGCTSISRVLFENSNFVNDNNNSQGNYLSEKNRMKVSFLFGSVLLDHVSLNSYRNKLQTEISIYFGINRKESEYCINNNKFSVHFSGNEDISSKSNNTINIVNKELNIDIDVTLNNKNDKISNVKDKTKFSYYTFTTVHSRIIYKMINSIYNKENILLVGDTGTGKTTIIQQLHYMLFGNNTNKKEVGFNLKNDDYCELMVYNFNDQTESSDIIGSYKPINMYREVKPLYDDYVLLLEKSNISKRKNENILNYLLLLLKEKKWSNFINSLIKICDKVISGLDEILKNDNSDINLINNNNNCNERNSHKKRTVNSIEDKWTLKLYWKEFKHKCQIKLSDERIIASESNNKHHFEFVNGILLKSIKEGHWLIFDEINLASIDILQRLIPILSRGDENIINFNYSSDLEIIDNNNNSNNSNKDIHIMNEGDNDYFLIPEKGNERLKIHPRFRLFSCMNPPSLPIECNINKSKSGDSNDTLLLNTKTTSGKKELPQLIRSLYTEYFVDELLEKKDLEDIVYNSLRDVLLTNKINVSLLVDIYLELKRLGNSNEITIGIEGNGHGVPNYSLRTFTNCLNYIRELLVLQNNWRKNQSKIKIIETTNNEKEIKSGDSIIQNNILRMDILEIMYNGIMMSFATPLTNESHRKVDAITKRMLNISHFKNIKSNDEKLDNYILFSAPKALNNQVLNEKYLLINSYIVSIGNDNRNFRLSDNINNDYILTPYVLNNMNMILRILSGSRNAILIEGETSTGKTSLIKYISELTNHKFVRINNHEHTDIEEYFGRYIPNIQGELEFVEGPLINSIRNGYWLVLDELNLAPSEVLESLNRLLDGNRELYIPETGEVIKAHNDFQLFATQNPAGGIYGGRKLLSQAFRNRFIEIYFDEIPYKELETIISKRCRIPNSYSQLMVKVYTELRRHRSSSQMFSGDYGFITVRDMLRWGNRLMCINNNVLDKNSLVITGFYVIGERVREQSEKLKLAQILLNICKPTDIKDADEIINYSTLFIDNYVNNTRENELNKEESIGTGNKKKRRKEDNIFRSESNKKISLNELINNNSDYILTDSFKRMVTLVNDCIVYDEPVLLVGSTGCGKTSIFQLLSTLYNKQLYIVNCHQQIEASDMLGSLRPIRSKMLRLNQELNNFTIELNNMSNIDIGIKNETFERVSNVIKAINGNSKENNCKSYLETFDGEINKLMSYLVTLDTNNDENIKSSELRILINKMKDEIKAYIDNVDNNKGLFEWQDGPIIKAMKSGNYVLLDEINLCDDSVIERLNSLLEDNKAGGGLNESSHKRIIHLTEKEDTIIKSHRDFRIFATMNPSGDYGKRELSPALRNRFNEIFVPSLSIYKLRYDIKRLVIKRTAKLVENVKNKELVEKLSECLIMFSILYENDIKRDSILEVSKDRFKDEDYYFKPLIDNKVNIYINLSNYYENSEISEFTIRDILSWCDFINNNYENILDYYKKIRTQIENYINIGNIDYNLILEVLIISELIIQGANMLIIDGICGDLSNHQDECPNTCNTTSIYLEYNMRLINVILILLAYPNLNDNKIRNLVQNLLINRFVKKNGLNWMRSGETVSVNGIENNTSYNGLLLINNESNTIELGPFYVKRNTININNDNKLNFTFESETTLRNMSSIIRSMSILKPILLQGSPGIGKTAIILTLSKIVGVNLHRINMSEQTDFSDLFGCEVPISRTNGDKDSENKNKLINWMDGILLYAMKNGDWVILDELNLATQQILEGLNSIMDHRRNIYIPEIGQTIICHENFRIFATQNPVKTGNSGRKGLPQSFLNRFVKINVNRLSVDDYYIICNHLFGNNSYLTKVIINLCIEITREIQSLSNNRVFNDNTCWEWNLRDLIRLFRFIQLNISTRIENRATSENRDNSETLIVNILYNSFESVYLSRIRNKQDYSEINNLILDRLSNYLNIERKKDEKILNSIEDNILMLNKDKTFLDYLKDNIVSCQYYDSNNSKNDVIFNNNEGDNSVLMDINIMPLKEKKCIYTITEGIILGENLILTCNNNNDMELMVKYIKLISKNLFEDIKVNVVNILFSLDANDLIGNYQQYDNTVILNEINELVLSLKMLENNDINVSLMNRLKMKKLQSKIIENNVEYNGNYYDYVNKYINMFDSAENKSIIKEIRNRLKVLTEISDINIDNKNKDKTGPNFQYIYSTIINSIKKGEWLIINNINNCSSALLDRLNSLLEDKENDLFIIESGTPEYIKRNRRFRLFLINNNSIHNNYISNALVNRCIEIFVDFEFQKNNKYDGETQMVLKENGNYRFKSYLRTYLDYTLCKLVDNFNCKICINKVLNHIIYECKCYNRFLMDYIRYKSKINNSNTNNKLLEIIMLVGILLYGMNNYINQIIHLSSNINENECTCINKMIFSLLKDETENNNTYNEHVIDIIDKKTLFIGWMNNILLNSIIIGITNKSDEHIIKKSLIGLFEQYGLFENKGGKLFRFYLDLFDIIYNDYGKIKLMSDAGDFLFCLDYNSNDNNLISEIYKDKNIIKYDHIKENYYILILLLMESNKYKTNDVINMILNINSIFSLYMKEFLNERNIEENIIFLSTIELIDDNDSIYNIYLKSLIGTISSVYGIEYDGDFILLDSDIIDILKNIPIIDNYDEEYNKLLYLIYKLSLNPLILINVSDLLEKMIKNSNIFIYSLNRKDCIDENKSQESFEYSLKRYFNSIINTDSFNIVSPNNIEKELYNKLIYYSNYFNVDYIKRVVISILKIILTGIKDNNVKLFEKYLNILELIELLIYNVLVLNEDTKDKTTPKIMLDIFRKLINKSVYIDTINILLLKLKDIGYDKINDLKMITDSDEKMVKIIPKNCTYIKTIYDPNNYVGDGIIINYNNLVLQEKTVNNKEIINTIYCFLNKGVKINDVLRYFTHIRLCNLEFFDYVYDTNINSHNKWDKVLDQANSLNSDISEIKDSSRSIFNDKTNLDINIDYYLHIKYVIYVIDKLIVRVDKEDSDKSQYYNKLIYYVNYMYELYINCRTNGNLSDSYLFILSEAVNIISVYDSFELYKKYISYNNNNETVIMDRINTNQANITYYYLLNIRTKYSYMEDLIKLSKEMLDKRILLKNIKENIILEDKEMNVDGNHDNSIKNEFLIKLLIKYDNNNSLLTLFLNNIYNKFVNIKFRDVNKINKEYSNMHYLLDNQLIELGDDEINITLKSDAFVILRIQLYNIFDYLHYIKNIQTDYGKTAENIVNRIVNTLYKKLYVEGNKLEDDLDLNLIDNIGNIKNSLIKNNESNSVNGLFLDYFDYIIQILKNKMLFNVNENTIQLSNILLKTCIVNLNLPTYYYYRNLLYIDENGVYEVYNKKIKNGQEHIQNEVNWHKCNYYHHHDDYKNDIGSNTDYNCNNVDEIHVIRNKKEVNELNKGVGDIFYIKETVREILQLLLDNELIKQLSNKIVLNSSDMSIPEAKMIMIRLYEDMVILIQNIIYKNYSKFFDGHIKYLYNDIVNPIIFLLNSLVYSTYVYMKYSIENNILKKSVFDNVIDNNINIDFNRYDNNDNLSKLSLALNSYELNNYFGFIRYNNNGNDNNPIKLWNLIMDIGEYILEYNNEFMQKYDQYNKLFEYNNKNDGKDSNSNVTEVFENVSESLIYRNDNIERFIRDNNILEEFDTINKILKDNESNKKYYNIRYICMRLLDVIILKFTCKNEYMEYLLYNKYYNNNHIGMDIWKFVLFYLNKQVNNSSDLNNNHMRIHMEDDYYHHILNNSEYIKLSESVNIRLLINKTKLIDKLDEITNNVNNLLLEYCDQPLLILIKDIVDKVLEINVNQLNINDLICYLDILLQRLIKWNEYIKEGVNININIDNRVLSEYIEYIKNVIYEVRKLQINSWLNILCKIYKKYNYKSCFSFGDILILISKITNYNDFNYVMIYNTLVEYLKYSTVGEFPVRLLFIKYLYELIKQDNNDDKIKKLCNVLKTITCIYDIVYKKILIRNTIEIKNLVKEIKDIIKLSLWDMKDYIKIKKNIISIQRQLKKLLNNYDGKLTTTVNELLDNNRGDLAYLYPKLSDYVKEDNHINYIIKELSDDDSNKNKMYKQRSYLTLIDTAIHNGISSLKSIHSLNELYYNNLEHYLSIIKCHYDSCNNITLIISECFIILDKIKENEEKNHYNIQSINNSLINYKKLLSIGNTFLHKLIESNYRYNINKAEMYNIHNYIFTGANHVVKNSDVYIKMDKLIMKKAYIVEYVDSLLVMYNKLKEVNVLLLNNEINIGDKMLEIEKVNILVNKLKNLLFIFSNYDYIIFDCDFLDDILVLDDEFNGYVSSVVFEIKNKVLNTKLYELDTIEHYKDGNLINELRLFVSGKGDVNEVDYYYCGDLTENMGESYNSILKRIFAEKIGDKMISRIRITLNGDRIKERLENYELSIKDEYDQLLILSKDTLNYIKAIYLLLENNFFNICEKKEEEETNDDNLGTRENIDWKGGCGFGDKSKEENDVKNKDISNELDDDTLLEGLSNDKKENEDDIDVDKDNNNAVDTELNFDSKHEDYNENDDNDEEKEGDDIDRVFDDIDLKNENSKIEDADKNQSSDSDSDEESGEKNDNIETKEKNKMNDGERDMIPNTEDKDTGNNEENIENKNQENEINNKDNSSDINEMNNSDTENVFEYEASNINFQEEGECDDENTLNENNGEMPNDFEIDDEEEEEEEEEEEFDQTQGEDWKDDDECYSNEPSEGSHSGDEIDNIDDLKQEESEENNMERYKCSNSSSMKDEIEGEKGENGVCDNNDTRIDDDTEKEERIETDGNKEGKTNEKEGKGIGDNNEINEEFSIGEDNKSKSDDVENEEKSEEGMTDYNPLLPNEDKRSNIFEKIKEILLESSDNECNRNIDENDRTYKLDGNAKLNDENNDDIVTTSMLNENECGQNEDNVDLDSEQGHMKEEEEEVVDEAEYVKKDQHELDVKDEDNNCRMSELKNKKDRSGEYDHIKRKIRGDKIEKSEIEDDNLSFKGNDLLHDSSDIYQNPQAVNESHSMMEPNLDDENNGIEEKDQLFEKSTKDYINIWNDIQNEISPMVNVLTNQLRIILEPTIRGKMEGSYKTGKKLSMKKVIGYIASEYRKDRIWLRRSKPSKREFNILMCIDNSHSMSITKNEYMALQSLFMIIQSLQKVEAGNFGVCSFTGNNIKQLISMTNQISNKDAVNLLKYINFEEESKDSHQNSIPNVLRYSTDLLYSYCDNSESKVYHQLIIIITDGRFNKNKVNSCINYSIQKKCIPVLIIIDNNDNNTSSIFDMKSVTKDDDGNMTVKPYLDNFPFQYYSIIQDYKKLPNILCELIKQWFELSVYCSL
ncbi:hypothetical protein RS030_81186 [Cryptosporidium xiaoi]|uniref:Midasin n=1 Tax=Cryptosporidium xiaoi TaxID=659607 RepID=A0AAV9XT73_9CRYT